ncbi:MAG TPA: putative Ig domain-containing protein [Fredinandcohnia sp.]|nr:putative Ig domain-containing protein [Fredinandcohnia sp.]
MFGPISLGVRSPNLVTPWVEAPELVRPGAMVQVEWIARNAGNLPATAVDYRVVLERNRFLSPASPTLATGMIGGLDAGEERYLVTDVRIPHETEPGGYFVGVQLNTLGDVYEHDRQDNHGFSLPVVVSDADLVVLTESLPVGHVHGHYEVRLLAAGGDGRHHWRVRPGTALPPGLRLEVREAPSGEVATFLVGQPATVGVFRISFVVTSGPFTAEVDYDLEISSAEYELSIATESLAEASFGFAYRDVLSAMGGRSPYSWEALGEDPLPHGIFLRSDGVLSGRPQEDGVFEFLVRVTDFEGRQATKTLVLNVAPPAGRSAPTGPTCGRTRACSAWRRSSARSRARWKTTSV